MKITKVIPGELSGYCDITTGECVLPEADASPAAGSEQQLRLQETMRSSDETRPRIRDPTSSQRNLSSFSA